MEEFFFVNHVINILKIFVTSKHIRNLFTTVLRKKRNVVDVEYNNKQNHVFIKEKMALFLIYVNHVLNIEQNNQKLNVSTVLKYFLNIIYYNIMRFVYQQQQNHT